MEKRRNYSCVVLPEGFSGIGAVRENWGLKWKGSPGFGIWCRMEGPGGIAGSQRTELPPPFPRQIPGMPAREGHSQGLRSPWGSLSLPRTTPMELGRLRNAGGKRGSTAGSNPAELPAPAAGTAGKQGCFPGKTSSARQACAPQRFSKGIPPQRCWNSPVFPGNWEKDGSFPSRRCGRSSCPRSLPGITAPRPRSARGLE